MVTAFVLLFVVVLVSWSLVEAEGNNMRWSLRASEPEATNGALLASSPEERNLFQDFADTEDFSVDITSDMSPTPLDLLDYAIDHDDENTYHTGARHLKKKGKKRAKAPTRKAPSSIKKRRHLKKSAKKNAKAPTTPKTPTTTKVTKKRHRN